MIGDSENNSGKDYSMALREIEDYISFILGIEDPFDRMWLASYELPYFILCRIIKAADYKKDEIGLILDRIIQWCEVVIHDEKKVTKPYISNLPELTLDIDNARAKKDKSSLTAEKIVGRVSGKYVCKEKFRTAQMLANPVIRHSSLRLKDN
ncbi:MAG: hypothetical protein Q8876_07660 [Bacillota bacterium]|nr:hypothetical protein [Bacillota bacterium]